MTPREFLKVHDADRRNSRGKCTSTEPLRVDEGERVGVVMLNLGGPDVLEDVEPFLYNQLMDPAVVDVPVGGMLRHWLCRIRARLRAQSVREDYEMIGGGSPINRLTREQAQSLERHLNATYADATGATFHAYVAMRYWHPFVEEAALQMEEDGIDKVVLLPLHPQYSTSTTGTSLAYWNALVASGEIPSWPVTTLREYAANPKYVQALSERIDEALQRFPQSRRDDVHLVFSAQGTPLKQRKQTRDPYCCLVHTTVEQVMRQREFDRSYHTAFQDGVGSTRSFSPSTTDTLVSLAESGVEAALVVPVSYVTDHVDTSHHLDIAVRENAEAAGIDQYEVTSGLNSHPLFVEALGEATVAQLHLSADVNALRKRADGVDASYDLRPLNDLPRLSADGWTTGCPGCEGQAVHARCWRPAQRAEPNPFDDPYAGDGGADQLVRVKRSSTESA